MRYLNRKSIFQIGERKVRHGGRRTLNSQITNLKKMQVSATRLAGCLLHFMCLHYALVLHKVPNFIFAPSPILEMPNDCFKETL